MRAEGEVAAHCSHLVGLEVAVDELLGLNVAHKAQQLDKHAHTEAAEGAERQWG